jgi:hypothetical protein
MVAAGLLLALTTALDCPFTLDRLELDLRVDVPHEVVSGTARLTVRNASAGSERDVPLLLNRLLVVSDAGGVPFDQAVVTFVDDRKRQVDFATVHLPSPVPPGGTATVAVTYAGPIVGYTETGSLYVQDRISEEFTILREDAYAFPVLGVPSLAASRRPDRRTDFTFDATLTVPRGLVAAAGAFVGSTDLGEWTAFRFASETPVPFLNLSVASFRILDEGGVRVYFLPGDEAGAKRILERTRQTLDLFASWFGPLGHPARLTVIEIPAGWGSQASLVPGIILTADSFRDPQRLYELYHELAHLWNAPDRDRPSARWNEGLSMWLQGVAAAALDGPDAAGNLDRTLQRLASALPREESLRREPFASYGTAAMTDWSYSVGRLYFALLDHALGRDALLAVLSQLYQAHKDDGVTFRDLTTLLERRDPRAARIDEEWVRTTAWTERVGKAVSFEALAAEY